MIHYHPERSGSNQGRFFRPLIPRIGPYRTFYRFALVLVSVSLVGLARMPARRRSPQLIVATALMLGVMVAITGFGYCGFVRPVEGNRTVIWQGESADKIKSVAFIGLAGGTATKRMTDAYGLQVGIDGVEIDPKIVAIGRRYFDLREPNVNVIVQDGRSFLKTTEKRYDVIAVDAYHQPSIPFQLTTKEFFKEVRDRLNENGSVIVNAGRTSTDYRRVAVISQTMRAVFPNVYLIDTPG